MLAAVNSRLLIPGTTILPVYNTYHADVALFDNPTQSTMSEGLTDANGINVFEKYQIEREKRLHNGGLAQYMTFEELPTNFRDFQADPWMDSRAVTDPFQTLLNLTSKTGQSTKDSAEPTRSPKTKILIQGCGFGGLLAGIHLVETGTFKPEDIVFVDNGCGWGGTWYWNRFPGLMCDIESYIYLPLLEETGYIPKHKYSYGQEIREYCELMAKKWGLFDRALWRTTLYSLNERDTEADWGVRAQFVYAGTSLLPGPKLPRIPNLADFSGEAFHPARWNYYITGGSQSDPSLTKLKGKSVGIIGTGATAVQVVPELAKWADHLYVFQRTPSQVDTRGQRETDMEWFKSNVGNTKGWQRLRIENFCMNMMNKQPRPSVNLVDDEWTNMSTYRALTGGYDNVTPDNIGAYLKQLHTEDLPRSERIRARVSEIVKDSRTAESLKSWYPGWCKRPTFHDDYLPTFNRPNVTLVDTDGKGVDCMTSKGPVVAGVEYPVDVLIIASGFLGVTADTVASRAGIDVTGRDGRSYDKKVEEKGTTTLYGSITRDFPNLFFPGPLQGGVSANYTFLLDQMARNTAYMMSKAVERAEKEGGNLDRVTLEPFSEAEEAWSMLIVQGAIKMSAFIGCTPSYLSAEGEIEKQITMDPMKGARSAVWGKGVIDYVEVIDQWKDKGNLEGLDVQF
ncbi:hypothetical protein D9757_001554 [Collybiopsis confluens]|uniref:Uncharacterized protein n=1 Tax=Collybiopsis confluens TaxID=2823264 RepID=A0A8H5HZB6_9AGAR|nr:hypothetical protein D9757_001554 [Collybiopsis confluens]